MAPAMLMSVAFMLAIAMVEANQCSSVGECPSDDKPQNAVSLLQTNVLNVGGDRDAPAAVLSQRSDGNGDILSSPKVAFLVRTYAPTAEMTKRITQWVADLPSDMDAFISIDRTAYQSTGPPDVSSLLNTLQSTGFNLDRIHRYTTDDMRKAYPELKDKREIMPGYPGDILAYRYVTASIDLFLQNLTQTYDYLWSFEDDVGYTGDMSKLLEKYSESADDLISGEYVPVGNTYVDFHQTDLYKERVPRAQRVMSENHVVRMSSRLLGRLSHWLKEGAIHSSEEMPPTVCEIEHMKCSALAKMDLGYPYEYQSTHDRTFTSLAKWEATQREDAELGKPRLYHPLKI